MADKKLNSLAMIPTLNDIANIYVEDKDGVQYKVSKESLASVLGGLLGNTFLNVDIYKNGVSGDEAITPSGRMGLIFFEANVNNAPESNEHASIWLYMNTVNTANSGYTSTGISVVKIASMKHDFGAASVDCSLLGSTTTNSITINKSIFNKFTYRVLSL